LPPIAERRGLTDAALDGESVDAPKRAESINSATGKMIGLYTEATEAEAAWPLEARWRHHAITDRRQCLEAEE
jgi:hypothetical protein